MKSILNSFEYKIPKEYLEFYKKVSFEEIVKSVEKILQKVMKTLENEEALNNEWNPFTKTQESTKEDVRRVVDSQDNITLSTDKAEVKVVKKEEIKVLPNTGLNTTLYALFVAIIGLLVTVLLRRKNDNNSELLLKNKV